MTTYNETDFDAKFDPQESPGQEEGSHFWTWEEVQAALKAGQITEQQVWTVVEDGEGGMGALAGWHVVNKIAYYVTRVPWVGGDEYGEFDDGDGDEEECYTPEEMDGMAEAYGEAPRDPDDGYYYSGTGEWSGDDSYIDYLNNDR